MNDRPNLPVDKLRAAVPEDHEAQESIDALHEELSGASPASGRIREHVENLRKHAPLSALVAAWFEDPRTQTFIQELTAAGL